MPATRSLELWLVGLLLGAGCGLAGCSEPPPAAPPIRPVRAITVGDVASIGGQALPGRARAVQEVDLSFRVDGQLLEFPSNVGDEVKEGQLLARLDPRDFEVSKNGVAAQLARAKAAAATATADLQRVLNIQKEDPGAVSQAEVDRNQGARDTTAADVQALEADLEDATNQLTYTQLTAPFEGRVVATHVENFEKIRSGQRIIRIIDDSRIEIVIFVPESGIPYVRFAREIVVTFDAYPDLKLPAKVTEVGTEASQTTRTFPVTVQMEQPEDPAQRIFPGMAGRVTGRAVVPEEVKAEGFQIPEPALVEDGGKTYVFLLEPAGEDRFTTRKTEVTRGELAAHGVVVQGLAQEQTIATAGAAFLEDGQTVRILAETGQETPR